MVQVRKFGMGQSVRRVEDRRFVTGRGRYTDDIAPARLAHAWFVRSPHARARILSIDTAAAEAAPGVLAVLTAKDAQADGLGTMPCLAPVGDDPKLPPYPMLTGDEARYAGDPVAMVVATSQAAAIEVAELVEVEYETLPAVADPRRALEPGAPAVWGIAPGNLCYDWSHGDKAAVDAAFAAAAHRVTVDLVNNRVVPNAMEPRAAIGEYNPAEDSYALQTGCQNVHLVRKVLCESILKIPTNRLHVTAPDVGGGFGMKIFPFKEHALVCWAARRVGRAVKWTADRADSFLADTHGRDHVTRVELAVDGEARIQAVRVDCISNLGAYLSPFAPTIAAEPSGLMYSGQYAIPHIHVHIRGAFTNTVPVDAYRGAGRPEASYALERTVDAAARQIGMDPGEFRLRNFISKDAFPYEVATGLTYDSGDYARNLKEAMEKADWKGFSARKAEAARRGRLRGIGLSTYIEICGEGGSEQGEVRFDNSGQVTVIVGTQSTGQGHETAFAQLVADRLGLEIEDVKVLQGDTRIVVFGGGTGGSRSLQIQGPALALAVDKVIAKGRRLAAHLLEAAEADIHYEPGTYTVAGTDRSVTMGQVAAAAYNVGDMPEGVEPGLDEIGHYVQEAFTFPNGCHVCEVEVDPGTGTVEIVNYLCVDEFGRAMNPLLLEGQVHGGIAQGIGQALLERCAYDEAGQLVTGSFMDYCMPRADDLPDFRFQANDCPSGANPLGVKGCGEAGSVGAPAAVINALVDALEDYGVAHVDMPATPEVVWKLVRSGAPARAAE